MPPPNTTGSGSKVSTSAAIPPAGARTNRSVATNAVGSPARAREKANSAIRSRLISSSSPEKPSHVRRRLGPSQGRQRADLPRRAGVPAQQAPADEDPVAGARTSAIAIEAAIRIVCAPAGGIGDAGREVRPVPRLKASMTSVVVPDRLSAGTRSYRLPAGSSEAVNAAVSPAPEALRNPA